MLENLPKTCSTDEVKMNSTWRQSAGKTEETHLKNSDMGWLAGIWDGEGTIGMYGHTGQAEKCAPRCSVTNTDFAIIEECSRVLHSLNVGHFIQTGGRTRKEWNPRKDLVISGHKRCLVFLETILPYLRGYKQYKAMLILAFIYSRFMKPGNGRMRGGCPFDEFERACIQMVEKDFSGNLNEFTPEWIDKVHKMYSELHRQYAEAAEMTALPKGSK